MVFGRRWAEGEVLPVELVLKVNRCLMKVGRIPIPVSYTLSDEFDHKAAVPIPQIPGLPPVVGRACSV